MVEYFSVRGENTVETKKQCQRRHCQTKKHKLLYNVITFCDVCDEKKLYTVL